MTVASGVCVAAFTVGWMAALVSEMLLCINACGWWTQVIMLDYVLVCDPVDGGIVLLHCAYLNTDSWLLWQRCTHHHVVIAIQQLGTGGLLQGAAS